MVTGLSQKERMLLQDQKHHEELCIEKYTKYANEAQDPQLKQLFSNHASTERQHLNTINQILSGQVPNTQQQGQQQGQQQAPQQWQQAQQTGQPGSSQSQVYGTANVNLNDIALAKDMLVTEKYVSGTYDTVIFECADNNARQALNHIQKEEQDHGRDLFDYLQSRGQYNPQ